MRIGIIGHFGGNESFCDGQTVKTVQLYRALKKYGIDDIDKIDTYYSRRNPIKFCLSFLKGIIRDKKYIILLSDNGVKMIFPILSIISKSLHKEVYHYAIGGYLAQYITENPKLKKYALRFVCNWVESKSLANFLQEIGLSNASYLPNFKDLKKLTEKDLIDNYMKPFRLCMFSRVTLEKGIEDAVNAIRDINAQYGEQVVLLDIYGPIEKEYEERLNNILKFETSCEYCGIVSPDNSVETLRNYYLLLFPTHWENEGIPGTIIDALTAGLPVISRRWACCDEMLEHKVTGYIYDFDKPEKLKDMILYAITHVSETVKMKCNCLQKAKEYSKDYALPMIVKQMGIER